MERKTGFSAKIHIFERFFVRNSRFDKAVKVNLRLLELIPSSEDDDSVETSLGGLVASNLGAVGLCFLAGFQ